MSDYLLVFLFLFLVLAPCLLAFDDGERDDESSTGLFFSENLRPRLRGRVPAPLQASRPEAELSENFVIRSFAKGLSERRILVRDTESGVKLTIAQVRAAAAELVRISGQTAAYEFALVTAAAAAMMGPIRNAVQIAAREAMAAAQSAAAWFSWSDSSSPGGKTAWDSGPPLFEDLVRMPPVWRSDELDQQAA